MNGSHYTPENWIDFVREVAPLELSDQMAAHLTEAARDGLVIPEAAATLLFDSNAAVLAGVRTTQPPGRTLLFGRDDFLIHVHIENVKSRNSIVVTGQIMEMYMMEPRVSGLRVRVVSELKTVSAVETNDLGEFRLEVAEARNDLFMVVEFVGKSVTIPLGDLIEVQS